MYDFSEEFAKRVETIFKAEMQQLYPGMPVQFEDVPFKQPKDTPWVSFVIRENPEEQITLGRKMIMRTSGFLQIDIQFPLDKGVRDAKKIGQAAADIFAYRKFKAETISMSFLNKEVVKAPSDGARLRIMARVFFYYDGERIREGVQHIA